MNILIATSTYPPEVGGSAHYAFHLSEQFVKEGHTVEVVKYGTLSKLPTGIKHLLYTLKVLWASRRAHVIYAMDSFLSAAPAAFVGKLMGKRVVARLGGDFFWEMYVEARKLRLPLPDFYGQKEWDLSRKERIIYRFTRQALRSVDHIAFNTDWMRKIFIEHYGISLSSTSVIANILPPREDAPVAKTKDFLFIGRDVFLKNMDITREAFRIAQKTLPELRLIGGSMPYEEALEKMKHAYAGVLVSVSDVSPGFINDMCLRFHKPFILTKHTGLPKEITDMGLLADPLDLDDIVAKIIALASPDVYDACLKKCHEYREVRTWDDVGKDFLTLASGV